MKANLVYVNKSMEVNQIQMSNIVSFESVNCYSFHWGGVLTHSACVGARIKLARLFIFWFGESYIKCLVFILNESQ